MSKLSGFKQFIEDMDPSQEKERDASMNKNTSKDSKYQDYFSALGDEEGITWKNIVSIFEKEPWVSAHFGIGTEDKETLYKLSPWEIVKGSLTPNGADIRLKPQRDGRSYLPGNKLNKSNYKDNKRYHLDRKELLKFLTTGWTPAAQATPADSGGGQGLSLMP
jgi:hypothetical protein